MSGKPFQQFPLSVCFPTSNEKFHLKDEFFMNTNLNVLIFFLLFFLSKFFSRKCHSSLLVSDCWYSSAVRLPPPNLSFSTLTQSLAQYMAAENLHSLVCTFLSYTAVIEEHFWNEESNLCSFIFYLILKRNRITNLYPYKFFLATFEYL